MDCIQLVIKSELSNVSLMAMAVNRLCLFCGMDEVEAYQVELCVSEAATNSILHAYHGDPESEVSLVCSLGADCITLVCEDQGKPMSCEQMNLLNARGTPLGSEDHILREGGRGLEIIRGVMDEVQYSTDGTANCLRMIKRLRRHRPKLG